MTTLKQFLVEQQEQEYVLNQAADAIVRDCRPYLNQGGGIDFNFYRGMEIHDSLFDHKVVRKNRTPLSTPQTVHQLVDQWFNQTFGHPYRSNSLIATGNPEQAEHYAESGEGIYIVFPIGEFSYVWSSNVADLYLELGGIDTHLYTNHGREHALGIESPTTFPSELTDIQQKEIIQGLENANYKTTHLQQAAKSNNEIMVACNSYYILDLDVDEKHLKQAIRERQ